MRMDEYENEFVGKNLQDFDMMDWFSHDFQNRLFDLSTLIFGKETKRAEKGSGFSNIVPMVLATVCTFAELIVSAELMDKKSYKKE
jgi:hypothetical protein